MKKIWLLTNLLVVGLLLTGCNKTVVEDPEIIGDCVISGNCMSEEPIDYESESNILSVDENKILSTDELKKACEKDLWGVKSENIVTTWTDEKLFINTYSFKGITETDWINTVYCNVTLDWVVLDAAFYLDEWQTIEELHKQLDYTPWSSYPNLKEYYWFVWTIVLWNRLQTTYITWKNTMYFDNSRWIAFKLWEEFDWWLIREIDTDEGWLPHSEIILLVKWEKNEENRTGINWYREVYTIRVDSKTNLKNFNVNPDLANAIWENNEYYFIWYGIDTNIHLDWQIFDVEEPIVSNQKSTWEEIAYTDKYDITLTKKWRTDWDKEGWPFYSWNSTFLTKELDNWYEYYYDIPRWSWKNKHIIIAFNSDEYIWESDLDLSNTEYILNIFEERNPYYPYFLIPKVWFTWTVDYMQLWEDFEIECRDIDHLLDLDKRNCNLWKEMDKSESPFSLKDWTLIERLDDSDWCDKFKWYENRYIIKNTDIWCWVWVNSWTKVKSIYYK